MERSCPPRTAVYARKMTLQQGIPTEKAKEIVRSDQRQQAQGSSLDSRRLVRVSGKDRDALQQVIALLKTNDFGIDMQFTNYRTTINVPDGLRASS